MVDFPTAVAVPSTAAYAPPMLNFNWLADLPNRFYQGKTNQFNAKQQQRTENLQKPIDATDTASVLKEVLARGGAPYAEALLPFMLQQEQMKSASQVDPLLSGVSPQGQQPQGNPPPASVSGGVSTNMKTPVGPQSGDAGTGTITDLVTAQYGQTAEAGRLMARVATTMGVDPNAPLSKGQQIRVAGLLKRYGGDTTPQPGNNVSITAPQETPNTRVADAFSAAVPGLSPPATAARAGSIAPQQQPIPQAPQPTPQPQVPQRPAPQAGAPGPIGPQVPLPKGYTDPQQAILALRAEAAKLSANPYSRGQATMLEQWAQSIEQSLQPMDVRPGQTLLDRRTGQVIFRSAPTNPAAQAFQSFMEANPYATPEQQDAFLQASRSSGRSAIAMFANRWLSDYRSQHNGQEPSADEFKRAMQTFTTQTTAQNRFLSGPQGNTIRSLNVVVSHLQTMQDLGNALANGNVRVFNSMAQRFSEETGNPAPTNFDTAKQIVGAEVIKALGVAGAGSQSERQEAADAFNRARSPSQLAGAIEAARKLLVGQLEGLRRQYIASTGLAGSSFDDMLEPETRSFFGQEESAVKAQSGTPDKDGWHALPNGVKIREVQ